MKKNVAGQKVRVFAFNRNTNVPVTGDAANITCKISKDNGTATALGDVNPTETEDGYYLFDLTQIETNADTLDFYPESSSPNTQVIVTNHDRQTIEIPPETEIAATDEEELVALQNLVGPKRVKTKEVEIEAHDPMKLQLLNERIKPKPVRFGKFTGTYVVPKYQDCCICEHPKDRE